jgi:DNA-binding MarR family transcriptional regulator
MGKLDSNPKTGLDTSGLDSLIHAPARLAIMSHLYVVESLDYLFLMRMTKLTWGNLATHLNKLEDAGYITVTKDYVGRKPHSMLSLTGKGRLAFQEYKENLRQVLEKLPE